MHELTAQQSRILAFLRDCIEQGGLPPTTLEIQRHFDFASDKAARDHLRALARKGRIELMPGKARGIRVLSPAREQGHDAQIPLVGRVAAGTPILATDNIDSWYRIDPAVFSSRANFLYRVRGNSMQAANILDGDIVGIRQQEVADNGQIVVARLPSKRTGEDEITLKRYSRRRDVVVLAPDNDSDDFRPIEIDLSQYEPENQERPPVAIEGILVGLIRKY